MLICVMLRLIDSQFSMIRSSSILRSISTGSSAANIAAGFGNGIMPGIMLPIIACSAGAKDCAAVLPVGGAASAEGASVGVTAPLAEPGIASANGFHIFCMNAIASSAENGMVPLAGLLVSSVIGP